MGKAKRKPRPSMPYWYFLGNDNCWPCKSRNHCNSCGVLKKDAKAMMPKKYKGRRDPPKGEAECSK